MLVIPAKILALLLVMMYLLPFCSCRYNRKYLAQGNRLIENVTTTNFSRVSLPQEPHLEFRRCHFPLFGPDKFRALDEATKRITFRKGMVQAILLDPDVLVEGLQVIDTSLVSLEAMTNEPNYYLKQLTIRSNKFSEWSASLMLLRMLEEIDIAYCNVSYLKLQWFEQYDHLKVLDVSKNRLTVFEVGRSNLRNLERLHIWGNQLKNVHRFPDAFPNLKIVTLTQNKWHCQWVSEIRGAIWLHGLEVMDMDSDCRAGWENNGGLCCRQEENDEEPGRRLSEHSKKISDDESSLIEICGGVIRVQLGNTVVYVNEHLPIM